jgi:predicted HTH domain antitoxin
MDILDESSPMALKPSEDRMAAAVKLFEMGRLSSGAAARLADVPRVVFLSRLADYGVDTFRMTAEDFKKETRLA